MHSRRRRGYIVVTGVAVDAQSIDSWLGEQSDAHHLFEATSGAARITSTARVRFYRVELNETKFARTFFAFMTTKRRSRARVGLRMTVSRHLSLFHPHVRFVSNECMIRMTPRRNAR